MTLTQLSYVVAVDQYKSFQKAAKSCFVTQPTLSIQIQKLEEELGVILFDRQKKPLSPTVIGALVVKQAITILAEENRLKELISDTKDQVSGDFHLGLIPSVASTLIPLFLPLFIKKYPQVKLIIKEVPTLQMMDLLTQDKLDGGIAATPLHDPQLLERPLYQEKFLTFLPKNHALMKKSQIKLSDLDHESILLMSEGHCFRHQISLLCRLKDQETKSNFKYESGQIESLIRLAEGGLGLTFIPELTADLSLTTIQKKQLRFLHDQKPHRQISLVLRRTYLKRKIIQALEECIIAVTPEHLKINRGKVFSPLAK
jgi:LysR family hydrogen peroxide-inducible transcriptional activator